jgi:glycosyltransferase involved in cell wall biosynthesis
MNSSASPVISVITTFHNAEGTLVEAIDSLLQQKEERFEVLLVDDGSNDRSANIVRRYTDPRLRLLQPGRVGRVAALNLALENARTDLVAILDADDRALPHRLGDQVCYLHKHPDITLLAGNVALIDRAGKKLGQTNISEPHGGIVAAIMELNPFAHSSVAFRRSSALAVGGYNPRCEKSIDFNFYLSLLAAGAHFAALPHCVTELRYYSESWGRNDDQALQMRFGILGLVSFRSMELGRGSLFGLPEKKWRKLRELFDVWFERRGFLRRHRARSHLRQAVVALRAFHHADALRHGYAAMQQDLLAMLSSGIGFRYPSDVDEFLSLSEWE